MTMQLVKTAVGRRLRDPKTRAVLPNVTDAQAKGFEVDLDDPHWFRALQCGDIVVEKMTPGAPAQAAAPMAAPVIASASKN
jgi:hypothetical protein